MKGMFLLPALVSLSAVLRTSYERLYGDGAPDESSGNSLAAGFERTRESLGRLLESTYIAFGSSILGMIVEPPDPDQRADLVFEEFHDRYMEFIDEFTRLIYIIRESSDEVREKLGSNWTSLDFVGTIFERETVEWETILSGTLTTAAEPVMNNRRVFCNSLAGRFMDFLGEETGLRKPVARSARLPGEAGKDN